MDTVPRRGKTLVPIMIWSRKDKVLFLQALYRHQASPWLKPFVSSKYLYVSVQIIMALPGHPQTYLPIYHIFIILCLVIYLYNHSIAAGQAFRIQSCCCHCGCCKCEDICFGLNIFYFIYMKRDWAEHRMMLCWSPLPQRYLFSSI